MQRLLFSVLCALAIAGNVAVAAQGVQTGTITGRVESADGAALPGVDVAVESPALQGQRAAVADVNGVYSLRALPPGTYVVRFTINGFQPAERTDVAVSVGGTTAVNAMMSVAGQTETVTVTAEAPSPLATTTVGDILVKRDIDILPVGRRPVDVAELSPGLTVNTFNVGQLAISGAFGYDNVFMVNGVDVNDNVFGTSNNLFIEDAIDEVATMVSGIPATYGRFTGGVVNVITRSGGNTFGGSYRHNLSNPSWIGETPRERANNISHADLLSHSYEGTFGGPLVRDRLWFFTAGRYEKLNTPATFTQTGGAYTRTDTNRRGELKVTTAPAPGQSLQASVITNHTRQANTSGIPATRLVDASTLVTRTLPNTLFAVNYNAVARSSVLVSAQYSQKRQGFRDNGGSSSSLANSPFQTIGASAGVPGGLFYHAPYLDATDPEDRNNHQLAGSVSYLWSSKGSGSHELKGGVEHFVSTAVGGNSQSSTNYVFVTDYLVQGGVPVLGATARPIPVFTPGVSEAWNFRATRGATLDITTSSWYAQDRWSATPKLTLDLGVRGEFVSGEATGDVTTADTSRIVPRLGAAFDFQGNGQRTVQATYGHYSGKYSQTQFASNTNVSHPSEVDYVYTGPAGQGDSFAPGFDPANYTEVVFANFPTANIRVADDVQSPLVREFSVGYGETLGQGGYAKVTYIWRSTSDFVEDFINLSNGITNVPLVGTLTNHLISNSDEPSRDYSALIFESSRRLRPSVTIGGHYTVQLRNEGSFAGEAASQPGISSIFGDYPEIFGPALDRLLPEGRFDGFQRHKLRVYGLVTQSMGRFGSVDVSPIWRVNSGTVYSLTAGIAVPAAQLARNPGYPVNDINPFVRETVFFGERGQYDFKGYGVVDLAATYRVPVWKSAAPWIKVEVYNALNNQKLIAWDKTISVDRTKPLDANGIPTAYIQGPRFGQATADNQFPQPFPGQNGSRAFRMSLGLRF